MQQELQGLRQGGSFPTYDTIDGAERKKLSKLVSELAQPVAGISDKLGG